MSRRVLLATLLACVACAAQGEEPTKKDAAAEVLDALPAVAAASKEVTPFDLSLKDQQAGWATYEIEGKPDEKGGSYSLRQHYLIAPAGGDVTAADTTAEVDSHFLPRKVRFDVRVKKGEEVKRGSWTLDVAADGCTLTREEVGKDAEKSKVGALGGHAVSGIEFLLQKLPRERIDGLTFHRVNAQTGDLHAVRIHVAPDKDGRVSAWYMDVSTGSRGRCIFGAQGALEEIEQGAIHLRTCSEDRLAELQKQHPDVK